MPGTETAKARARDAADDLLARTGADTYDAVVVLGSGWAEAADALGAPDAEFAVGELSGFSAPTAVGHSAAVRSLWVGTRRVLVFLGRTHLYEGHGPMAVAHAVRTGIAAGAGTVLLTNAAGSLRTDFAVGQPIIISDHLNLTGRSPLVGPNFVDLTEAYGRRLRAIAHEADPSLADGVYAALAGPQYETPAEIRMLRMIGADLVGMSTVLETIAAREMGAEVLGLSLVTNAAAGLSGQELDSDEVIATGRSAAPALGTLLHEILRRI